MAGPAHFDCPKCGRRYYDAQRFCVECGLDFRAAFRQCPKCKKDTPMESERCINCDYDLVAHDMRRPKIIAGLIVLAVAALAVALPYWWMHTPIGKRHGTITTGELFFTVPGDNDYVPMFYQYQSGTKALRKARTEGGWRPAISGMDASRLFPLPEPTIPYVNVVVKEKVYVISKRRDIDGNEWYRIRRYRTDVTRDGWVHESNVEFDK
jgi:hypothetical protein